jgi:uncharacterized protein (DUF1015 family)
LGTPMVDIAPFRGWRYNPKRVPELEEVVAPPYDVIEPAEQRFLHQRHPWNVVRLDFGEDLPGDDDRENRYARAAAYLSRWRREGILLREEEASVYVCRQAFTGLHGERMVRTGFIALVRLEPLSRGRIFPHEETFSKHRTDRLNLLRATRAHFNPIFSIYPDPDGEVDAITTRVCEGEPLIALVDGQGVEHALWALEGPGLIRELIRAMRERPLFIADGHHRYETCLNYWEENRRRSEGMDPGDPLQWTMMYLTPMEGRGLVILPTHKMVRGVQGLDPVAFLKRLEENFLCRELPSPHLLNQGGDSSPFLKALREEGSRGCAIGMALHGRDSFWILTPRDAEKLSKGLDHLPECLRSLDVTILHEVVFLRILGIDVSDPRARHLTYLHDANESLRRVRAGEVQMAFIMNPTKIADLKAVASAGYKMPHKATYFYPKLLSGMVINVMEERIQQP